MSTNWMNKLKILFVSSGVVSLAMAVKLCLPWMTYELPKLFSVILSLFKPPYLYAIINGIIITIVVSTRFSHRHEKSSDDDDDDQFQPLISAKTPPPVVYTDALLVSNAAAEVEEVSPPQEVVMEAAPDHVEVNDLQKVDNDEKQLIEKEEEEAIVSEPKYTPPQTITTPQTETETETLTVSLQEKPLALSRFAPQKSPKAIPEGGGRASLRVARPRKHETLESTWRMITEGGHVPLTRHVNKSPDTSDNHGSRNQVEASLQGGSSGSPRIQRKVSWGRIHREASPSQDELNRRVEAFIKKFNEEMRLQREESLKQYMEMINRGV